MSTWVSTLVPLAISLVTVLGGGGLIKVFYIDKALVRSQEAINSATAGRTASEGEVAHADAQVKLSDSAIKRMNDAEDRATTAREDATTAQVTANRLSLENENLREEIADLRRDLQRLEARHNDMLARITACTAGTACPIATSLSGN